MQAIYDGESDPVSVGKDEDGDGEIEESEELLEVWRKFDPSDDIANAFAVIRTADSKEKRKLDVFIDAGFKSKADGQINLAGGSDFELFQQISFTEIQENLFARTVTVPQYKTYMVGDFSQNTLQQDQWWNKVHLAMLVN